MLILGMTPQEIRVLQEYRRVGAQTLSVAAIQAIRHPVGGGEAPAVSLVDKGYLKADGDGFTLTEQAREFLAIDYKPDVESPSDEAEADA